MTDDKPSTGATTAYVILAIVFAFGVLVGTCSPLRRTLDAHARRVEAEAVEIEARTELMREEGMR